MKAVEIPVLRRVRVRVRPIRAPELLASLPAALRLLGELRELLVARGEDPGGVVWGPWFEEMYYAV
jgi:hypothetical protein